MKKYLTAIFIGLSIITVIIGLNFNFYWSGMVAWGIAIILLLLAIYTTKFIPNENEEDKN